jgi:inner membrane protein
VPSVISHAVVAVAAGVAFAPPDVSNRFWPIAVACSVMPDMDTIGFFFGIPYHHFFGHRGFFHSPFWAFLMSLLVVSLFFHDIRIYSSRGFFYLVSFFLVTASHGILDAFTSGGLGIALLSPFEGARYFFPRTPIEVSPIGIGAFFSRGGFSVMKSELLWVWLPSFFVAIGGRFIRFMLLKS